MSLFGCWSNGYLRIGTVDFSDHAREITLETTCAELPANVHGQTTATILAGLESWTVNVVLLQDFAASEVDATLSSLGGGAHVAFSIVVGADATSAVSATNPRYSGSAVMTSYRPIGGQHGVNLEASCTFRGATDLIRQTVP